MRKKKPFSPALNPLQITAVVVERLCCGLLLSRQTQRVTVRGVLFTAPAAPTLAVQLDGRWRGPPPSVTAAAAASLDGVSTQYGEQAAPAASRLWLEEEGTTCSVVQPRSSEATPASVDEASVCGPLGNTG